MNIFSSIIINNERRLATGTNLYDIVVQGRSLTAVLEREAGMLHKSVIEFQVEFDNGKSMPFMAYFSPDEDWVRLDDIVPCTEAGHLYL